MASKLKTAWQTVCALRSRGYCVALAGDRLRVSGPPTPSNEASRAYLAQHWRELRDVVRVEQSEPVQAVLDVFADAVVTEIRLPSEEPKP